MKALWIERVGGRQEIIPLGMDWARHALYSLFESPFPTDWVRDFWLQRELFMIEAHLTQNQDRFLIIQRELDLMMQQEEKNRIFYYQAGLLDTKMRSHKKPQLIVIHASSHAKACKEALYRNETLESARLYGISNFKIKENYEPRTKM